MDVSLEPIVSKFSVELYSGGLSSTSRLSQGRQVAAPTGLDSGSSQDALKKRKISSSCQESK